jgi:DnaJ-class molecular chaperone
MSSKMSRNTFPSPEPETGTARNASRGEAGSDSEVPCNDCAGAGTYSDGLPCDECKGSGVNVLKAQPYWCNKCGYRGTEQIGHQRPNGTGECGYIARQV